MNAGLYDPLDDPPQKLHHWHDLYIYNYEEDLQAFWGIGSDRCPEHLSFEEWQLAKRVDAAFPSLLGSISELALNPKAKRLAESLATPGAPLQGLPRLSASEYLGDRLQVSMALEANRKWIEAAKRAQVLLLLLGQVRLNDLAQAYVQRTTELYLWGFDPEAIVMASCVLERALRNELAEAPLEQHGLRPPKHGEWDYRELIDGAQKIGIFTESQAMRAHELRRQRNDALHLVPGAAGAEVEKALWTTYELLARLAPARRSLLVQ